MGQIFKILAVIIWVPAMLWGFFVSMGIVIDNLGFFGGLIVFIFPPALAFAPLYAAIADSNWFPLVLVYGGVAAGAIPYGIGYAIDGD